MIGLLLLGGALAIGHHLFYQSLHGTWTPDGFSQQLNTAYGSAFAFIAKAALIAAVVSAYTQHLWSDLRKKFIRVSTVDSKFTATSSVCSLLDPRFLWGSKVGAVIAALAWLLPLSAIVTPATLSVRSTLYSTTAESQVPVTNFTAFTELREGDSVKVSLTRLSKLVTCGVQIPPIQAFVLDASYTLEFLALSLKCDEPLPDVRQNLDAAFRQTGGAELDKTMSEVLGAVYVAFSPFTPITYYGNPWPVKKPGEVVSNITYWEEWTQLCLKDAYTVCSFLSPAITSGIPTGTLTSTGENLDTSSALWVRLDEERLSCSIQKTRYTVEFDAHNAVTALKSYDFKHEGVFKADTPENAGFIIAMQPLLDVLSGTTYFNRRWCFLKNAQMTKCTTDLPYRISCTSIHETALSAMIHAKAHQIYNRLWDIYAERDVTYPHQSPAPTVDTSEPPLTRNLTLGTIIEEMSRNLTLSYFTSSRYLAYNSSTTAVTTSLPVNVYHYNTRNLVLAYAIAFGTSALAVAIGLYIFVKSGCANATATFSSILCATAQNRGLGELVERTVSNDDRLRSGSMVAPPGLMRVPLKYGVLVDEREERGEGLRGKRCKAFGVAGQVL